MDAFSLQRFIDAQRDTYATALAEIRRGRKQSHWMWFIFPQVAGLGVSTMSRRYAIQSVGEARAYLAHPVLGARLVEACEALLEVPHRTATEIFGSPDDLKLRSSMTLFAHVSPPASVFARVLARLFDGDPDARTLELVSRSDVTPVCTRLPAPGCGEMLNQSAHGHDRSQRN